MGLGKCVSQIWLQFHPLLLRSFHFRMLGRDGGLRGGHQEEENNCLLNNLELCIIP